MKSFNSTLLILLLSINTISLAKDKSIAPPLVDGDCGEYKELKAKILKLSEDVDLNIYQDEHYVWACYTYPEGSFGTLDLTLKTKVLEKALNLHVSAQLGQWPADQPELAPQEANSDLWWITEGWTANTVWFNGMDKSTETPRFNFKNAKARELQFSKEQFGRGSWQMKFNIRSIKNAKGESYSITYPEGDENLTLKVK